MRTGARRRLRHRIERALARRFSFQFPRHAGRRLLILSVPGPISQSQVFPFHFYWQELRQAYGLETVELDLSRFEADPEQAPGNADVVMVQTWIDLQPERCERIFSAVRRLNPSAKIIYLDSFAPTDLRFADMLNPHIDLYVKKHVLRDRTRYGQPTLGDTNLSDYYGPLYGVAQSSCTFTIPAGFMSKLVIGPTFCAGQTLLPGFYDKSEPPRNPGTLDVHARLGASGDDWYGHMRRSALAALDRLPEVSTVRGASVPVRRYLQELGESKICFSAFGYGEVCWRDYEAISRGSLLLKPDMAHLETDPDIFHPGQTYVPIAWDFSDLEEKVRHYLRHDAQRMAISSRAYEQLHRYARSAQFVKQVAPWLVK